MAGDVSLDQPFDQGSLPEIRAAVQARARSVGMPEDRAMDVVLAVHELMANAIRHGAGKGRLRVWLAGDALRCQVDDEGAGARPGRDDPWPVRHGHGLWVVRQVSDGMEVLSGPGGTRATISFTLPADPMAPRPADPASADSPE
jgi:anti-sigma regulatory factor (Ser/Thr protein kinase)